MSGKCVAIVGSGPAGLTAAIYAARGGLTPIVITGQPPGGALMTTTEVENFPGFPDGIAGPELMDNMRRQAVRLGAEMVDARVESVDFQVHPFKLVSEGQIVEAEAVIIAVGSAPRALGLPQEMLLRGRGVSTCATCDGFFFKNKDVVVVGSGDSAMEEAVFLSRVVRHVTVLARGARVRASQSMLLRARACPNVELRQEVEMDDILGDEVVTGVRIRRADGSTEVMACSAVFVAIGHAPSTGFLRGQLELDESGYVRLSRCSETSVAGVFAAGDVYDRRYMQAVTAAASGCKAALDCIAYLEFGAEGLVHPECV